jgi:hypothetical protein
MRCLWRRNRRRRAENRWLNGDEFTIVVMYVCDARCVCALSVGCWFFTSPRSRLRVGTRFGLTHVQGKGPCPGVPKHAYGVIRAAVSLFVPHLFTFTFRPAQMLLGPPHCAHGRALLLFLATTTTCTLSSHPHPQHLAIHGHAVSRWLPTMRYALLPEVEVLLLTEMQLVEAYPRGSL